MIPDELDCFQIIVSRRWPNGVACPRCESSQVGQIKTRSLFQCNACDYQFSVRVGTVLQDSQLPLWKWFVASEVLAGGASNMHLARVIGVPSKTAWKLARRIDAFRELVKA